LDLVRMGPDIHQMQDTFSKKNKKTYFSIFLTRFPMLYNLSYLCMASSFMCFLVRSDTCANIGFGGLDVFLHDFQYIHWSWYPVYMLDFHECWITHDIYCVTLNMCLIVMFSDDVLLSSPWTQRCPERALSNLKPCMLKFCMLDLLNIKACICVDLLILKEYYYASIMDSCHCILWCLSVPPPLL
jgi:hypothetical protein